MGFLTFLFFQFNPAIEVLGFTPDQGWSDGGLNRETALIWKPPFHHCAEHSINGVVGWFAFEVVFITTMAFEGDHRHGTKFAALKFFLGAATVVVASTCFGGQWIGDRKP